MNRPFTLDENLTARLADLASRTQRTEDQLLDEAVRDYLAREDGRAGFLAEARRQTLAVAASPDAEADQAFVDAVSDWADT
jgi:sigma54-dependent transcription regulator